MRGGGGGCTVASAQQLADLERSCASGHATCQRRESCTLSELERGSTGRTRVQPHEGKRAGSVSVAASMQMNCMHQHQDHRLYKRKRSAADEARAGGESCWMGTMKRVGCRAQLREGQSEERGGVSQNTGETATVASQHQHHTPYTHPTTHPTTSTTHPTTCGGSGVAPAVPQSNNNSRALVTHDADAAAAAASARVATHAHAAFKPDHVTRGLYQQHLSSSSGSRSDAHLQRWHGGQGGRRRLQEPHA